MNFFPFLMKKKRTVIKSLRLLMKLGFFCEDLIVFATTDHLLASGSQEDRVLVLSRVAALDIAQRRVWVNYACIAQALQRT